MTATTGTGARVVAIVQSRFGSSRLPGKALRLLSGKPMLWHVLHRATQIAGLDEVVLATSDNERDLPLADVSAALGLRCFRGPEHDVLERFARVSRLTNADVIMRLTGDCPLLDPAACAEVLRAYLAAKPPVRFASNDTTCSGHPDGTDCEVFSADLLYEAAGTVQPHAPWVHGDREHVTSFMRRTARSLTVAADGRYDALPKLSIDSAEDYERVQRIYAALPDGETSLAATLAAWRKVEG